MVGRINVSEYMERRKGSISEKWGFSSPDGEYHAYVFDADFDAVLEALNNTLGIEKHLPNVYGQVVTLNDRIPAILYRLKESDYIILDVDWLISETIPIIPLWRLSELILDSMVAKFFTGEETGYVIYRNGQLEQCFIPGPQKIKGYEDLEGQAFYDHLHYIGDISEHKLRNNEVDENPLITNAYYHAIDRLNNINTFIILEEITIDTPYPNGKKLEDLGIYIPSFYCENKSESNEEYLFDFLDMGDDPFDRIDCLWFSPDSYISPE